MEDKVLGIGIAIIGTIVLIGIIAYAFIMRPNELRSGLVGAGAGWSLRRQVVVTAIAFLVGLVLCSALFAASTIFQ